MNEFGNYELHKFENSSPSKRVTPTWPGNTNTIESKKQLELNKLLLELQALEQAEVELKLQDPKNSEKDL